MGEHITARFPKATEENSEYIKLIKGHQLHKCSNAVNGCLKDGVCTRGFGDITINAGGSFNATGYPIYHRSTFEDLKIVPHNRLLLLDWESHCNVEFCGSTHCILYLYKVIK